MELTIFIWSALFTYWLIQREKHRRSLIKIDKEYDEELERINDPNYFEVCGWTEYGDYRIGYNKFGIDVIKQFKWSNIHKPNF